MIPLVWMVTGALGTCALAIALTADPHRAAVTAGMAGPLAAAAGTWIAVVRTHRRDPAGVSALMIRSFAVKMVYFAAFVLVALGAMRLPPVPFIMSFTAYFVALYAVEALLLARLFSGRLRLAR